MARARRKRYAEKLFNLFRLHASLRPVRAGQCLDMSELHLAPLPLLVETDGIKIAVTAKQFNSCGTFKDPERVQTWTLNFEL